MMWEMDIDLVFEGMKGYSRCKVEDFRKCVEIINCLEVEFYISIYLNVILLLKWSGV